MYSATVIIWSIMESISWEKEKEIKKRLFVNHSHGALITCSYSHRYRAARCRRCRRDGTWLKQAVGKLFMPTRSFEIHTHRIKKVPKCHSAKWTQLYQLQAFSFLYGSCGYILRLCEPPKVAGLRAAPAGNFKIALSPRDAGRAPIWQVPKLSGAAEKADQEGEWKRNMRFPHCTKWRWS